MKILFLLPALLFPLAAFAQPYSIDWHKIAGGGGTSTSTRYEVSGTIGQPDASMAMSGGQYSLTGGFWSLVTVVQTAGLPNLTIAVNGTSVVLSWPDTGAAALQQNDDLTTGNWTASVFPVVSVAGTNVVTIVAPAGNLFFRLAH